MQKSSIKKSLLLLSFLFTINLIGVPWNFALESSSAIIQFEDIQDSYSRHDIIEFAIHNRSKDGLLFYCAVEKSIDGQWREVVPSIAAVRASKVVKLSEVAPNQAKRLKWDRDKRNFYSAIDSGLFRFKLEILEQQGKKPIGRVFSKAFRISP